MTPNAWSTFRSSIDASFKADLPVADLPNRISATEGAPLTRAQYEELQAMGTDVVRVGKKQYTYGPSFQGLKLFRLVRPVRARASLAPRRGEPVTA